MCYPTLHRLVFLVNSRKPTYVSLRRLFTAPYVQVKNRAAAMPLHELQELYCRVPSPGFTYPLLLMYTCVSLSTQPLELAGILPPRAPRNPAYTLYLGANPL